MSNQIHSSAFSLIVSNAFIAMSHFPAGLLYLYLFLGNCTLRQLNKTIKKQFKIEYKNNLTLSTA